MPDESAGDLVKEAMAANPAESAPAKEAAAPESVTPTGKETGVQGEPSPFEKDDEYRSYTDGLQTNAQTRIRALFKRLKDAEEKASRGLSEEEIEAIAIKRGFRKQEPVEESAKDDFDALLKTATDQQRPVIEFMRNLFRHESKALAEKIARLEETATRYGQEQSMSKLRSNENEAKAYVEKKGLPWADVQRRAIALVEGKKAIDPNWGYGLEPMDIVRLVLDEHSLDLGKKAATLEAQQLNDKKRQIQVETEAAGGKAGEPEYETTQQLIKAALRANPT